MLVMGLLCLIRSADDGDFLRIGVPEKSRVDAQSHATASRGAPDMRGGEPGMMHAQRAGKAVTFDNRQQAHSSDIENCPPASLERPSRAQSQRGTVPGIRDCARPVPVREKVSQWLTSSIPRQEAPMSKNQGNCYCYYSGWPVFWKNPVLSGNSSVELSLFGVILN